MKWSNFFINLNLLLVTSIRRIGWKINCIKCYHLKIKLTIFASYANSMKNHMSLRHKLSLLFQIILRIDSHKSFSAFSASNKSFTVARLSGLNRNFLSNANICICIDYLYIKRLRLRARLKQYSYGHNILILPSWPYLKTAKKWNIFHPSHIIRRLHEYLSLASLVLIHSNLRRSKVVYNAYFYTVILHSRRAYFKPLSILHLPPHYFSSLFWELSVHGTLILMAIASLE